MLFEHKAKSACVMTYISLLLIFLIILLWHIERETHISWPVFAIQCLPLIVLLPGLLLKSHRTFSWLCFIILLYFVLGVMNSMQSLASWLDHLFLFSTVSTFISAMLASRWLRHLENERGQKTNFIVAEDHKKTPI